MPRYTQTVRYPLREWKFQGTKAPRSESSMKLSFSGAKRPGSKRARERKFQGARRPGSERAKERKFQGANWPGSEKARYQNVWTPRHQPDGAEMSWVQTILGPNCLSVHRKPAPTMWGKWQISSLGCQIHNGT